MSERKTHHPATQDNAILLLAAAEELGVDKTAITLTQDGFTAPDEVLDKAFPQKKAAAKTEAGKSEKSTAKSEE